MGNTYSKPARLPALMYMDMCFHVLYFKDENDINVLLWHTRSCVFSECETNNHFQEISLLCFPPNNLLYCQGNTDLHGTSHLV